MRNIKAVIFDWAGTTVDYGCFAPVQAFKDSFLSIGVMITDEMARRPMVLPKQDHLRAIAAMLPHPVSETEIVKAYAAFEASLFADIENHCALKDHVIETAAALQARGIKIGSTTGYTSAMMERVLAAAERQGYAPDCCVTPDQTAKGRPYPYMIWENMKQFGLTDPREAVKIGDTVADIDEGSNARCWTVGLIMGSSQLGLGRDEVAALSPEQLAAEQQRVRAAYYQAGADYIINDLDQLPAVIDDINHALALSEPHKLLTPGPLTTRNSVKNALHADHCTWDDEYKQITAGVLRDITAIAANDDYATVLLPGSGSYAVEAMINCLTGPGEKILFLVNGEYGGRMLKIATNSGKIFTSLRFDETRPVNPVALEKQLRADGSISTVIAVHCETTTGVLNPLPEIVHTAKKYGKKMFVDAMSSFGAYEIDMPGLDIDALASSANKCLEGLPGLAFVITKKGLLEQSHGNSASHSLDLYDQYQGLYQNGGKFRFTSPTNILLALRQALNEYQKEGGLTARRARYRQNHAVLMEGLTKLGLKSVVAPEHQSYIISTFALGGIDFTHLYQTLKSAGFIIYPGKLTDMPTFRLGNIGDLYPPDMEALVQVIGDYLDNGHQDPFSPADTATGLPPAVHRA